MIIFVPDQQAIGLKYWRRVHTNFYVYLHIVTSVVDLHDFDADSDADADPDLDSYFLFDADPDPTFHSVAGPHPDPDPCFKKMLKPLDTGKC